VGRLTIRTVALAGLVACQTPETQPNQQGGPGVPDQIMVDVKTTLTDEQGARRSYLLADSALTFDQERRVEFRKIRLTFFGDEGQQVGILTSRTAVYRIDDGTLDAFGEAAITLGTGTRLTAARLRYDSRTSRFSSDTTFVLESKTGNQTGLGFSANLRLSDLTRGIPRPKATGDSSTGKRTAPPR
jgi:LPS export ABC transporter protein LptC